jgi:hypothetical protein
VPGTGWARFQTSQSERSESEQTDAGESERGGRAVWGEKRGKRMVSGSGGGVSQGEEAFALKQSETRAVRATAKRRGRWGTLAIAGVWQRGQVEGKRKVKREKEKEGERKGVRSQESGVRGRADARGSEKRG